jgi:type III secretion protein Q
MTALPPSVPITYAPPRLTRNEAEARTLLAQHVQRRKIKLGDTDWLITLEPLPRGASIGYGAHDWVVRGQWGAAELRLRLPGAVADQWIRARFGAMELPEFPKTMRAAAFESALHDVFAALDAAGHGAIRMEAVEENAGAGGQVGEGHHFGLAVEAGGLTLWGTLSTDSLGLMQIAELAARRPAVRGPVNAEELPVVLRAEIGTSTLTYSELRGLRPGDAVMVRHCWIGETAELWLRHEEWGLRARKDGAHLVVTAPFGATELSMDDEFDDVPPTADGLPDEEEATLESLPVRLHFDLGQRSMPLGEVAALQVGQVVELARPLSQAVSIRANGALIGTGELMEIGGRIAVGITSLGTLRGSRE